jgi:hypothetical protein
MFPATNLGWQPFGAIERKSFMTRRDPVAGSSAAVLQAIRSRSEEKEDGESRPQDLATDENGIGECGDGDDGARPPGISCGVTPVCDGEVPTALITAMAELHQGHISKPTPMERWMQSAGGLSAVNVVSGRMQDVYNSINAVRMSMVMRALAEIGSPVHMRNLQQTGLPRVECEVCEAVVIKRWKIDPQMTGINETTEKMLKSALTIKMVAEPATWSEEIEETLRALRVKTTTEEKERPYDRVFHRRYREEKEEATQPRSFSKTATERKRKSSCGGNKESGKY